MKPFKYQYFALFFIFLFISIGSVAAAEDYSTDNGDLSSHLGIYSNVGNSINNSKNLDIKNHEDLDIKDIPEDFNIEDNINDNSLNIKDKSSNINPLNIKTTIKNSKGEDNCICSVGASKITKTIISSKSLSINYGADGYVVGYLKNSSGKAIKSKVVKITINGKTWSKTTDSNGKISLKIPLLNPSTYSTKLSFATCSGYSASSCLITVTVKKLSTKVISNNVYAYDNNDLVAYLKDSKNNPLKDKLVKFTIDGNTFNAFSDSNGQVIFNIPSYLKAKNYTSTIKFIGDKYYLASTSSVKVCKFDNSNIESFISQLINSKEFKELITDKSINQSVKTDAKSLNQSLKNSTELASIAQLLNNLTGNDLESVNQFLNLISSDKLDLTKSNLATSSSNEKTDTNIIESVWKWLNTPILEIPGYSDLDKKYGVFGQGLKLAGWFLLGIDDNGGLNPLDIGLDALSICSGAGLAECIGLSSSSLILKVANKFPRLDSLLKSSVKIKGLEYSITIKSLFNAYKSGLSILNNPIKFVSSKVITNTLDKWNNKVASFAMGYISNSFLTVSNVLGLGEVYVNSKDNRLFTTKILSNIGNSKSIKLIVNGSSSPIASTLKNIKTTSTSVSNAVKGVSTTVTKTVAAVKNTVSSTVNKVTTAVKSASKTVASTVKKVTNTVKKISKAVKSKVSKTVNKVKKTVKKVASKVKSAVKKASKTVKKAVKKTTKAIKRTVKKTVNKVKKTVKKVVSKVKTTIKKTVKSISAAIKRVKFW